MVALLVLGQYHEVIVGTVGLTLLLLQAARRHVHLAADDGLEAFGFQLLYLGLTFSHGSLGVFALLLTALKSFDTFL